jgi:hypothetical protein
MSLASSDPHEHIGVDRLGAQIIVWAVDGVPMLLHIGPGSGCLGGGRDLASSYAIPG